jgi:hypothetical protein
MNTCGCTYYHAHQLQSLRCAPSWIDPVSHVEAHKPMHLMCVATPRKLGTICITVMYHHCWSHHPFLFRDRSPGRSVRVHRLLQALWARHVLDFAATSNDHHLASWYRPHTQSANFIGKKTNQFCASRSMHHYFVLALLVLDVLQRDSHQDHFFCFNLTWMLPNYSPKQGYQKKYSFLL